MVDACSRQCPNAAAPRVKASGQMPHGGGRRLTPDSQGYQTLLRWIQQGMPSDLATAPKLERLEVVPSSGSVAKNTQQQLTAVAHYADGTSRDISHLALFESNDKAMAEVNDAGLVTSSDIPGKVAIMVRFQGRIAVFNASIPQGALLRIAHAGELCR